MNRQKTLFILLLTAMACNTTLAKYGGGTGEPNDPYQIWDANHMHAIGADANDWDKHFILMADIDLSEYTAAQFNVIGACRWELEYCPWWPCEDRYVWVCDSFSGVFDGNGHNISNFTYTGSEDTIGLFRKVTGHVKNLGLVNADVSGPNQVGTLVGYLASGRITECYAESAVVSGNNSVGGLVGESSGRISDSYALVSVMGADKVGGLIGKNGGFISDCYAAGAVAGGPNVGGLAGYGNTLHVRNSFWDREASGQSGSRGGIGKTTGEMQKARTYYGWSCKGLWTIDEDNDYPHLAWEGRPGEPIPSLDDLLSGGGSEDDPYLIYEPEHVNMIGWFECELDKHFKLVDDVNMAEPNCGDFRIIGHRYHVSSVGWLGTWFSGVFDGNGHTISNFQYVSSSPRDYVGLFGFVNGTEAEIRDLGLVDVNVDAGEQDCVGGLVGKHFDGTLSRCYAEGGSVSGETRVGGLVGWNTHGEISQCYSSAAATGYNLIGGLVGESTSTISNSYATGPVSGSYYVGGLLGMNNGLLHNSYATGAVSEGNHVGGLVGHGGVVANSFWDTQTSGRETSSGGTGKTTEQMQTASTFLGWNRCREIIWTIDEGNDYPRLAWQGLYGAPLPIEDLSDFVAGGGTEDDPYLIYTAGQLNKIALFSCEWDRHFKLRADIDLSGYTGNEFNILAWFSGVFDGCGHVISNFTYTTNEDEVGLFGYLVGQNAEIKNLHLRSCTIDAGDGKKVGALVGAIMNGTVRNCSVEDAAVYGAHGVGGLAGHNTSTISGCSAVAEVFGTGFDTGGLVGWNYHAEMISDCYAAGTVRGNKRVGGLVGYNTRGNISKCYSVCSVTGNEHVGGLVGYNLEGTISASFWNSQIAGQSSAGGTPKSTDQMQSKSTFTTAGWNFLGETASAADGLWVICEGLDYPKLAWQYALGDFDDDGDADLADFSALARRWHRFDSSFFCGNGCDLTNNGNIGYDDLMILAHNWLAGVE